MANWKKKSVPKIEIRPQPGPQERFLASGADIVIYGGAAFSGKSFGLVLDPIRHINNPDFNAVIFRKTYPQVCNPGGLWDETRKLYPLCGGVSKLGNLEWEFPSKARIRFGHLQHDDTVYDWQGAQVPMLGFDELTHFSWFVFNYMLSRNRSVCNIRPYIRGTCNPDPDSWLRKFLDWWIDNDTGYPIQERAGVIRWWANLGDAWEWSDTKAELVERLGPECEPKSVTFIPAKIHDNPIGLKSNPGYLANLKALDYVHRMQLLEGNWNVKATAGTLFRREWFEIVKDYPKAGAKVCRFWDRAATEKKENTDPDYTVGLKLACVEGTYYVLDIRRIRGTPQVVNKTIRNCASQDGVDCWQVLEREPGASGKAEVFYLTRDLAGLKIKAVAPIKDKVSRAEPVSAQAEAGNVKLIEAPWNKTFLDELENFPVGAHDDQVDGLSGGFDFLVRQNKGIGFYHVPGQADKAEAGNMAVLR